MGKEYKIITLKDGMFSVLEVSTVYGKRLSVDETESDAVNKKIIYTGSPSDCYSIIKLNEGNYISNDITTLCCDKCNSANLEYCENNEYACLNCGHFPIKLN